MATNNNQSNSYATYVVWVLLIASLFALSLHINAQGLKLQNVGYSVYYDTLLNCPRQVRWTIHKAMLIPRATRMNLSFRADGRCPRPRVSTSDFSRSGLQRGHMCPAADMGFSADAMRSTFLMSNIAPQAPALNMGRWKHTEDICRELARNYGRVSVGVAPLFLPDDTLYIGKHHVAVPHAFFKVAFVPDKVGVYYIWCFMNY